VGPGPQSWSVGTEDARPMRASRVDPGADGHDVPTRASIPATRRLWHSASRCVARNWETKSLRQLDAVAIIGDEGDRPAAVAFDCRRLARHSPLRFRPLAPSNRTSGLPGCLALLVAAQTPFRHEHDLPRQGDSVPGACLLFGRSSIPRSLSSSPIDPLRRANEPEGCIRDCSRVGIGMAS
jgi:hypothetical protein